MTVSKPVTRICSNHSSALGARSPVTGVGGGGGVRQAISEPFPCSPIPCLNKSKCLGESQSNNRRKRQTEEPDSTEVKYHLVSWHVLGLESSLLGEWRNNYYSIEV